jgi:hypothetical protein
MNPVIRICFVFIFAVATCSVARAQATRTWVSGVGDDVNPCSRTAPCKTFAGAISKTAEDGEISCLDPGGYGAVTITKSITIDCTGTLGSILGAGTNGVNVSITNPADTRKAVVLRGISINGAATGVNGVRVLAANSVVLDNVVINGFGNHGVSVEVSTGSTKVVVDHTKIYNNGGHGINFYSPASTTLSVNNSALTNNTGNGLNLAFVSRATIKDSTVTGNGVGLLAYSTELAASNCIISNNATGVQALSGGNIRLSGDSVTSNTTGITVSGGSVISSGNNMISGNNSNGAPTSTEIMQ